MTVSFEEPEYSRRLLRWLDEDEFALTPWQTGCLSESMAENGVSDWFPNLGECVEVLMTPKKDGALKLPWICSDAANLIGADADSRPFRFDAEYVCTWLPARMGRK